MTDTPTTPLPPFKKLNWLQRDIELTRRDDGSMVMRSRVPLQAYPTHIPSLLHKWADERPDQTWLAQRRGADGAWLHVSYAQARQTVNALTQALLDLGAGPDKPVAILSGNSIEHALMTFAAMQAGAPAAPVSPAYSLLSQDHVKLRYIFELIRPAVVMVQDGPSFAKALAALDLRGVTLVHVQRAPEGLPSRAYAELAATPVTPAVDAALAALTPDSVGKLLFTSGSTGMPKAVINTQRMMCANMAMSLQTRAPAPGDAPPVYLDWLPWNHTMGGNATFHTLLGHGGTLYIDDGRPLPGAFDTTLRNLREVSPTSFSNVPAGYAMLATALEQDDALARKFFARLNLLSYGGATLSDDLYLRMQALAVKYTGQRIVFFTGWGSTETAPTATSTYWETERVGLIGLPHPGVELKLVPAGPKYELRLRGVIVTPGYHRQPELTQGRLRRGRLLQDRRCRQLRRPRRPGAGPGLRRPGGRGLQARIGHLRACRPAARGRHRCGIAGDPGRAGGRPGQGLCCAAGLAQPDGLPAAGRQARGHAGRADARPGRAPARARRPAPRTTPRRPAAASASTACC